MGAFDGLHVEVESATLRAPDRGVSGICERARLSDVKSVPSREEVVFERVLYLLHKPETDRSEIDNINKDPYRHTVIFIPTEVL